MLLYRKVADYILKKIADEELREGDMIPSENKLIGELSFSRGSVRKGLEELEKKQVIYSVRGKGRFVRKDVIPPDIFPSQDNGPLSFMVEVISHSPSSHAYTHEEAHQYNLRLINGLQEACYAGAMRAHYSHYWKPDTNINRDGIIITCTRSEHLEAVRQIQSRGIPLVLINPDIRFPGVSKVTVEDFSGSKKVVGYLAGLGHRKIGCITVPPSCFHYAEDRVKGYKTALEESGMAFDASLVLEVMTNNPEIIGEIKRWFSRCRGMSAIFVAGGWLQQPVARFLKKIGKKVPEDISIAFFDSATTGGFDVEMTGVDQPVEQMSKKAVELLGGMMKGTIQDPVAIAVEPVFIMGDSCLPFNHYARRLEPLVK